MAERPWHANIHEIDIDDISEYDKPFREDVTAESIEALAENILQFGLVTPIVVYEDTYVSNRYIIVDGYRRYRAYAVLARREGRDWYYIPANIINLGSQVQGLLANLTRLDYNPVQYGEALETLRKEAGLRQNKIAALVGKSPSLIAEYLSLLKLPEPVRNHARKDGHAPFNFLKTLAAAKLSDAEKIELYEKKYGKCAAAAPVRKKASRKKQRLERLPEKLGATARLLSEFDPALLAEAANKDEILAALQNLISNAQALMQTIAGEDGDAASAAAGKAIANQSERGEPEAAGSKTAESDPGPEDRLGTEPRPPDFRSEKFDASNFLTSRPGPAARNSPEKRPIHYGRFSGSTSNSPKRKL